MSPWLITAHRVRDTCRRAPHAHYPVRHRNVAGTPMQCMCPCHPGQQENPWWVDLIDRMRRGTVNV